MIIKLGGLEVRTGKDARTPTPANVPPVSAAPVLLEAPKTHATSRGAATELTLTVRESFAKNNPVPRSTAPAQMGLALCSARNPHPITAGIVWPDVPEDPVDQTRLSILVNQTDDWFRQSGSIDICTLRDYLRQQGCTLLGRSKEAYDLLHEMHCVKFHNLHPSVVAGIPTLYTEVFRALKGEYDINPAWR